VVSILDELVDTAGDTKSKYFMDGFHLSTRALPLMVPKIKAAFAARAAR
jgi:hypothetical protein